MFAIYKKQLQKTWFFWFLPIIFIVALAFYMVLIWPEFEPLVEEIQELLENPLYETIIGKASVELGITSFEGLISMEMFIVSDIIFIALILLFGTMIVVREVDSGTLDIMLSYPVPRWKFLLEKLLTFITVTLSFPILTWIVTALGAAAYNIEFNNEAFFWSLLGRWILYMTLTCIVILCSIIFMDTMKTLGSAGLILGGSFILERLGGLVRPASEETADILQDMSLFHYLDGAAIMNALMENKGFPLEELAIILIIGFITLLVSLVLFQTREFK